MNLDLENIFCRKLWLVKRYIKWNLLIPGIILILAFTSCETDPYGSHWVTNNGQTIGQYLESNQGEFSKSYSLFKEGKMLITLFGYNPYDEGYTLFLPTDQAIDNFLEQNPDYETFEDLLQDTSFIKALTRYHTVNRKVHTDEFPYGALNYNTLTGERLVFNFYTDGDHQLIKVNNLAPIIKSNMEMTNGYIHIISEMLNQVDFSGYDWLQDQEGYSILAKAMELSGIRRGLWFNNYTILAEHDSIYHRSGIMNIDDLINHVAPPGMAYSSRTKALYQYTAYHIIFGDYYLNDLNWGSNSYWTLSERSISINVGSEIKINPGTDTLRVSVSENGNITYYNYITFIWEGCNIKTKTGPVHSITDLLGVVSLQ